MPFQWFINKKSNHKCKKPWWKSQQVLFFLLEKKLTKMAPHNTSWTHHTAKGVIERDFCNVDMFVIVFCTIAFKASANIEGAWLALHMGPSHSLYDYVQEFAQVGLTWARNRAMLYSLVLTCFTVWRHI